MAEKPLDQPLTTEAERQISTSLFWQLHKACDDGSRSSVITDLDPPEGAQYAQGREAWQSLIEKVNTKLQLDCQASGWNRKLLDCVLTRNGHVNDFNSYVSKLKMLKRLDHSERSLFTLFTESILDSEYNNTIKDGIKKGMTLEALQVELCADEQMNTDRSEKLWILKARRAVKEVLVETKGEGPVPSTRKKGGEGSSTPKKPLKQKQAAWKQLRVTIKKKYWSVLSEGQQKEFKEMNDEARSVWWHKNAQDIKQKMSKGSPTEPGPPKNSKDNPSEKSGKKVNWKNSTVTNGRFRMAKSAGGSCLVIDGGSDFTSLAREELVNHL